MALHLTTSHSDFHGWNIEIALNLYDYVELNRIFPDYKTGKSIVERVFTEINFSSDFYYSQKNACPLTLNRTIHNGPKKSQIKNVINSTKIIFSLVSL